MKKAAYAALFSLSISRRSVKLRLLFLLPYDDCLRNRIILTRAAIPPSISKALETSKIFRSICPAVPVLYKTAEIMRRTMPKGSKNKKFLVFKIFELSRASEREANTSEKKLVTAYHMREKKFGFFIFSKAA